MYINNIYVGGVTGHFSQIYEIVMALDWCHNFVSEQMDRIQTNFVYT